MKTNLPVAVLVLAACAPAVSAMPPTFTTSHGVKVFDSLGVLTPATAEAAEAGMLDGLDGMSWGAKAARPTMLACLARLEVQTMPGTWDCNGNGQSCVGVTHGDVSQIEIADMRTQTFCGVQMPYAHELGHFLQGCLDGDEDSGHNNAPVWAAVDAVSKLQYCR